MREGLPLVLLGGVVGSREWSSGGQRRFRCTCQRPVLDGGEVYHDEALVRGCFAPIFCVRALCFANGDFGVLSTAFEIGDVDVLRPAKLVRKLRGSGAISPKRAAQVDRALAGTFRNAA